MKNPALFFFLLIFYSTNTVAQINLKGIWNGYITTDGHDARANYILNIEVQKDGVISGKALLFKPNIYAEAFGLQQFFGTVNNNEITITDVVILDERTPASRFFLCFKLSQLKYSNDKNQESLIGTWRSNAATCLPGQILLKKYMEDEVNNTGKVPDYVMKALKSAGDTPLFKNTELSSPIVLNVKNLNLEIQLKDYLRTDNDTVSIYLNRRLIINRLNISKKPFKFNIRLSRNLALNELILFANNLGKIPPNTSLLTVSDGEIRHRVLIESTLQKSVAIYLKRSSQ